MSVDVKAVVKDLLTELTNKPELTSGDLRRIGRFANYAAMFLDEFTMPGAEIPFLGGEVGGAVTGAGGVMYPLQPLTQGYVPQPVLEAAPGETFATQMTKELVTALKPPAKPAQDVETLSSAVRNLTESGFADGEEDEVQLYNETKAQLKKALSRLTEAQ